MAAKCRTERGPTGSAPGGPRDTTHAAPRVGDLDVAPAAVDHVPLAEHAHLRLERGEPDEAEAFALARLGVLLHLRRNGRPSAGSTPRGTIGQQKGHTKKAQLEQNE